MSKSLVFLWVMVALIAGVALRSFVAVPYVVMWVAVMIGAVSLATGLARRHQRPIFYGLLVLVFFLGVFRFDIVAHRRDGSPAWYGRSVEAEGIVVAEPSLTENSQRLKVKTLSINGQQDGAGFFTLITTRKYPQYQIGDELEITGKIEQPENFSDFDYVSYLARDNIRSIVSFPNIQKTGGGRGNPILLFLSRLKHVFEHNIEAILPEPHAAFLKGLILGERSSLPQELITDFQNTGTSHMIALSGYNITVIGNALSRALLALTIPFAISFWCASGAIVLFIIMTGASASVVRAGIMGMLLLIAQKEGRAYRMTSALVFAAGAMVMQNPYVLRFDAGFQLSFGATLGLVYISPYVERWLDELWRRVRRDTTARAITRRQEGDTVSPMKRILIETIAAQIAVLPLLIFLFGRVSLISPIVNVLVLLVTPYAMGIGFVAAMLAFVSVALGRLAGGAAWIILEYQLRVIALFARVPFAGVALGNAALAGVVVLYLWIGVRIWRKSERT